MSRYFPSLIALGLILSAGTLFGYWSDRWNLIQADFDAAAEQFQAVPATLGEWDSQELPGLDERQTRGAGVAAYLGRRYFNRHNPAQRVDVMLFCGRPGPLCTHTPDLCFPGAGVRMTGAPRQEMLPLGASPQSAEFKRAEFVREESALKPHMEVYWSFSATGAWTVPDRPRFTFGRFPILYKLYLAYDLPAGGQSAEEEKTTKAFIQQIFPQIQQAIFQDAKKS